ncbi:copper chaperone PCu(A)C [Methylocella sp.]|uniref:copper chaperone PCu(A)C n=1 Tax=Methylocella sp. TaxID=1978226 RepID=UPI0035AE0E2D
MMFKTRFAAALIAGFAALSPALAHELKQGAIAIEHPWARATPAGARVTAGYMTLNNAGETPDRLVSVSSEIADHVSLHQSVEEAGVRKMRLVPDGLAVPAKGGATLQPGGYHVMFEGLKRPLKEGESFPATLAFEKAGAVVVNFMVEPISAAQQEAARRHDGMRDMRDMHDMH